MEAKVLSKKDLPKFLDDLRKDHELVGPKKKGKNFVFDYIEDDSELQLDYPTTSLPPKKVYFPPEEDLYEYKKDGNDVVIKDLTEKWARKRALLGVHPCDIKALQCLDKVFGDEYKDPAYLERRKMSIVIGMTCSDASPQCFCVAAESGPDAESGYDLLMTDIGTSYYFKSGSEAGNELLAASYFKDAEAADTKKRDAAVQRVAKKMPQGLNPSKVKSLMEEKVNDKLWDEYSKKCVLCGACNFVCPTCHCFTIVNEPNLTRTEGKMKRTWDACHFKNFAKIAGEGNFRGEREARVKHRLYDKLHHSQDMYGDVFCVGCGRCIVACPASIDIREVVQKVAGVKK